MNTDAEFWSHVDRSGGPAACWPWTAGTDDKGYGSLKWRGKSKRAHQVALELHLGRALKNGSLHTCDNPPCCNGTHLFEGTRADNNADKTRKGRQAKGEILARTKRGDDNPTRKNPSIVRRGERHGMAKLTTESVAQIRLRLAAGERQRDIAASFGVSRTSVSSIGLGRYWKQVQP